MKMNITLSPYTLFTSDIALAQMEIKSLFKTQKTLNLVNPTHQIRQIESIDLPCILERIACAKKIDHQKTLSYIITQKSKPHSEYYLTHWLYPSYNYIPPRIIRYILNITNVKQNETILAPFDINGVIPLECNVMSINCISRPLSPLSLLQSRVKTHAYKKYTNIVSVSPFAKKCVTTDPVAHGFSATLMDYAYNKKKNDFASFLTSLPHDSIVRDFYVLLELMTLNEKNTTHAHSSFAKIFSSYHHIALSKIHNHHHIMKKLTHTPHTTFVENIKHIDSIDGIIATIPLPIDKMTHHEKSIFHHLDIDYDDFCMNHPCHTKNYETTLMDVMKSCYSALPRHKFFTCIVPKNDTNYFGSLLRKLFKKLSIPVKCSFPLHFMQNNRIIENELFITRK